MLALGLLALLAQGYDHDAQHHGNPEELGPYIARMEDPSRDAWQKPEVVLEQLALKDGQTACDIGAGPGYFSFRLAHAVGPTGHVFAIDVEPKMLAALASRIQKHDAHNVTPVLGLGDDPLLPPATCDLVLIVDTYQHLEGGPAYLKKLVSALKPGGRIVDLDFIAKELPVGPPPGHKLSREDFLHDAKAAGLQVIAEPEVLPDQYFVVLRPR